jgi:hypothetical protein
MLGDYILGFVSFVSLDENTLNFFGFSEFISGLALMVLAESVKNFVLLAGSPLP